ncbi:MAG: MmcQ/YjbR family DNA-binding protein [Tepidiformaceae bacterium]
MTPSADERLRVICLAFPGASERPFGGHTAPTYRVRDKMFAMTTDGGTRPELWVKGAPGAQDILVESQPDRFFVPPYVGKSGWVGIWLDGDVDWDQVESLVRESYCLIAPKRLAAQL